MADFDKNSILEIEGSRLWLEEPWDALHYSNGMDGFQEEIENFVAILSPTQKEIDKRTDVFNRIKAVILQKWPHANVETFGSFRFGLFLPSSDIDIRVLIGDGEHDVSVQRQILIAIKDALTAHRLIVEAKTKLLDGKLCEVAVLKVTDKISTVNVDIVAKRVKGPDAAALISWWCDQWPMAPKLFLVLKHFIVFHNLDGVYRGGLNSYSLIIMTVCFLRMKGKELNWNMDTVPILPRKTNLGSLLYEFFHFYGKTFDYQNFGLRINDGGSFFVKEQHQRVNVLTIEDPLEQNHNISGGTFGIGNVKLAFGLACEKIKQPMRLFYRFFPREGFLGRIVRVSPSTIEYRKRILQDFTHAELQALINSKDDEDWKARGGGSSANPSRSHGNVLQTLWPRHNHNNNNILFSTNYRNGYNCAPRHYRADRDFDDWRHKGYTRRGYH